MRRDDGLLRQYLKKARKSARLTISRFSALTRISAARCKEFERGIADPTDVELEIVAGVLGMAPSVLTDCEKRYLRWRRTARRAIQFAALAD